MRIGLVVGHSLKNVGARSPLVLPEYRFWLRAVTMIESKKHTLFTYTRDDMYQTLEQMKADKIDMVLELHYNAVEGTELVVGAEILVHRDRVESFTTAKAFLAAYCEKSGQRNRGVLKIYQNQRGASKIGQYADHGFMTAFIFEPCFNTDPILGDARTLCGFIGEALDEL